MITITGATGQLGRIVINRLLESIPADQISAVVRNPVKAEDLSVKGVVMRRANYDDPASLDGALAGTEKLLLISSSEVGKRAVQHGNVIEAAKRQGVGLLVYTSLLHADASPMGLAKEHRETEAMIRASGLPFVILRNGWYTENYMASVSGAMASGVLHGSAGTGKISSAARADYAEAAVKVLAGAGVAGRVYELAGDVSYTLEELAEEISRQSGRKVVYQNLPEAEYRGLLIKVGLPEGLAGALASWDVDASKGALFDEGRQLSGLIGRGTTPLAEAVKRALG